MGAENLMMLGNLIAKASYNPDKYARKYDPATGMFTDASGKTYDTPNATPGLGYRIFDQEQVQPLLAQNESWRMRPALADQQYKIDTDRAGKQWSTLTPAEQQAYGNDPARYATAMTGYSLGQGLGEKSAAEKMKAGLPALEASKDVASANESIARSLFGTDKWNNARSIGLAEKENNADLYRAIVAPTLADASADEARVSSALNKGRLGNNYIPLTLRNEGLQQGLVPDTIAGQRRAIQSLLATADSGDRAAITANNLSISDNANALATAGKRYELADLHTDDSINKAWLSGQLSSANLRDVDTLKNTQQLLNRKENYLSRLIGHPSDPYLQFVQLNGDVTERKSPFKNLKIAEKEAEMESVMGTTGETTKAAHDASGKAVPIPSLKEQPGVIHPNMEKPIAEIPVGKPIGNIIPTNSNVKVNDGPAGMPEIDRLLEDSNSSEKKAANLKEQGARNRAKYAAEDEKKATEWGVKRLGKERAELLKEIEKLKQVAELRIGSSSASSTNELKARASSINNRLNRINELLGEHYGN